MEGARLRCSLALPREVAKPGVIEDHGEKVTLKAGQEIVCNLVCVSSGADSNICVQILTEPLTGCGFQGPSGLPGTQHSATGP
jgi:hypothetical protein